MQQNRTKTFHRYDFLTKFYMLVTTKLNFTGSGNKCQIWCGMMSFGANISNHSSKVSKNLDIFAKNAS